MTTRSITINLFDTHVGIRQDDANDPSFRAEIYQGVLRLLKRRGWKVTADPRVAKNFPAISKDHRIAARGDLRAEIEITGRYVKIEFWAETWPIDNPNGRRYDFNKRARLNFLDRLRVDLETRHIINWLREQASVQFNPQARAIGIGPGQITALQAIADDYAKSWHRDPKKGRPVCTDARNRQAANWGEIEHAATVWTTDQKGRVLRGTAYYHINNMWWVVTNPYTRLNKAAHELFTTCPPDLRRKRNEGLRRERLEGLLANAIRRSDFLRADRLKRIAFGDTPTCGIWSTKRDAYYRPNYCGYTSDSVSAGRYTWEEAEREVRRVPHNLQLVTPDGKFLSLADLDGRRAA